MYSDYKALAQVALAPKAVHVRRLLSAGKVAAAFVAVSLAFGMGGYMLFEHLGVVDAFLNASMILSGMGPLHSPTSTGGKIFAGLYAIFSGFAVLGVAAVVFAPLVHRAFHRLHIADMDRDGGTKRAPKA
jgi:hypothetical protein